jgi:hypothetical protein
MGPVGNHRIAGVSRNRRRVAKVTIEEKLMRRWYVVAGVLALAGVLLIFALTTPPSSAKAHEEHVSVTSFDDVKITAVCNGASLGESMGLTKPTVIERIDGVDAAIFATSTEYTACVVRGTKDIDQSGPTPIRQISSGVGELESFGAVNKVPGRALFTTDTWFIVRTSPTVSTIKAVTRGWSQGSTVRDGFAFIHEKETADVKGKFIYGVVAGFSAGGELVGSAPLT